MAHLIQGNQYSPKPSYFANNYGALHENRFAEHAMTGYPEAVLGLQLRGSCQITRENQSIWLKGRTERAGYWANSISDWLEGRLCFGRPRRLVQVKRERKEGLVRTGSGGRFLRTTTGIRALKSLGITEEEISRYERATDRVKELGPNRYNVMTIRSS